MWARQLADLSLLTERKTLRVRRTINMSLLRSEENLRRQDDHKFCTLSKMCDTFAHHLTKQDRRMFET